MRFSILFLLLFYSCSVNQLQKKLSKKQSIRDENLGYFVSVPISKFSSAQLPCLNVEIEGQQFLVKLDLGFRGNLSIEKNALDSIYLKTFIGEKLMYGIRGKEYRERFYRISKAKIGSMAFSSPIVQEENEEFLKDALLVDDGKDEPLEEVGSLGWELFLNSNLVIDMPHSQIAFCDSLETLAKQGYKIEQFTRAPLFLERGLVEFNTETSEGTLRCMLDTGATLNILNSEVEEEKSIGDLMLSSDNVVKYPSLKISGEDFGSLVFHQLPIKTPIQIEAILGMDFFKSHLVFLDFKQKYVYFSKRSLDDPLTIKKEIK